MVIRHPQSAPSADYSGRRPAHAALRLPVRPGCGRLGPSTRRSAARRRRGSAGPWRGRAWSRSRASISSPRHWRPRSSMSICASAVPAELRDYLAAMHEAATLRNDALRAQLEDVAARLNSIGVVPVALKGAIRLIDGLWPDRALRFMHDLDLLVPEDALHDCAATLMACGWARSTVGPGEAEHHLSLQHPDATARVELHRQPLAAPYAHLLTAQGMTARASPLAAGQAVIAVPALDDQLVHLVAHGMLQHAFLENGRFLLRDLVEQRLLDCARRPRRAVGRTGALHGRRLPACLGGQPDPLRALSRRPGARSRMEGPRPALADDAAAAVGHWRCRCCAPAGWVAARLLGIRSANHRRPRWPSSPPAGDVPAQDPLVNACRATGGG